MSNPTESVLAWAANQIAPEAKVVAADGLHYGSNPWLLRIEHDGGTAEVVLRVADDRRWPPALANEATALRLAAAYGLAAPRLVAADLDGSGSGTTALLQTVLPGDSRIPPQASDERLRAFGAAGAALHAIARPPDFELPVRTHPIPPDDHALERRWALRYKQAPGEQEKEAVLRELHETLGWPQEVTREGLPRIGTPPLLMRADEELRKLPVPSAEPVLIHGDLWLGNTMWIDDTCVGLVDLGSLGVGHYGVDLGYMRLTMAIEYGLPAADVVLDGWQRASGRTADDITEVDTWLSAIYPYGQRGPSWVWSPDLPQPRVTTWRAP